MSTLTANAREQLTISTPYSVPHATVLEALCDVRVTMIFPRRIA